MARPTESAGWATGGAVLEPSSGKKTTGWLSGERPPPQWMNWWQNVVGRWIGYLTDERDAADARLDAIEAIPFARTDQSNTFDDTQLVDTDDAEIPLIGTTKVPADAPGFSSNAYKLLFAFRLDGGARRVRFYVVRASNAPTSPPTFAVTYNAQWSVNTGNWYPDDLSFVATALFFYPDHIEFRKKASTVVPWLGFDDSGDIKAGGGMRAEGTIVSGAHLIAHDNVSAGGEFLYSPAKTRTKFFAVWFGANADLHPNGINSGATGADAICRLFMPPGSMGNVEVLHQQITSTPSQFTLYSRSGADWNPAAPVMPTTTSITAAAGPGSSGPKVTTLSCAGTTIDPAKEYFLLWHPGSANDYVSQVRMVDLAQSAVA